MNFSLKPKQVNTVNRNFQSIPQFYDRPLVYLVLGLGLRTWIGPVL